VDRNIDRVEFPEMSQKDPRIDAYVARAAPFARPILEHLRALVHRGCPEVVETVKWSMPAFDYHGPFCSMAAFKEHATFGFWRAELIVPGAASMAPMAQFGRLTSLADLPPDTELLAMIRKGAALNEAGVKGPPRAKREKRAIPMPADLAAALKKNAKARATFEGFSPSHRREYLAWITEAKTDDTRKRRLATTLEWLAEGKPRNWKYMAKPKAAKSAAKRTKAPAKRAAQRSKR
jgi:hypothetical protein